MVGSQPGDDVHYAGGIHANVDPHAPQDEPATQLGLDRQGFRWALEHVDDDLVIAGVQHPQVFGSEDLDTVELADALLVGAGPEVLVQERGGRLATSRPQRDGEDAPALVPDSLHHLDGGICRADLHERHARGMRRPRALVVAATLSVGAIVAGACGGPSTGTEVRSHEPRDDPQPSAVPATVAANAALGAALYRPLAARAGNFVFSPFGVSLGLAMAQAGAGGTTAEQLNTVQHVVAGQDLPSGLNTLMQVLADLNGDQQNELRKGRITLQTPDALWGQKDTRFEEPFLASLARSFGTGMRVVDFRSDPEAARHAMNSWVSGQTQGNITELVPRGVITETTRLEATAAAYLQAPWDQRFDLGRSTPTPFTRPDGQTVSAIMMELRAPTGLLYSKEVGWQAVEIPYLGRKLAMVVIIPDAGQLGEFEGRLDGPLLQHIVRSLAPKALDLHLPRFGFTTQGELDDPLSQIGAPSAFTASEADFSGMTANEALWISGFSHQAFLSADEEGTEASAVTIVPAQPPVVTANLTAVTANRPFIVMVVDRATSEPLFLGRVTDPTD